MNLGKKLGRAILNLGARLLGADNAAALLAPFSQGGYNASHVSRLTQDWVMRPMTEDAELRRSLRGMRLRSRELAHNEDFAKKFLTTVRINVVGASGIRLQNQAKNREGVLDTTMNEKIEDAWAEWCKKENACVEGTMSFRDLQNLFIESIARDGEVLIRKVKGADNAFRYSLQFFEADHLDENYNLDMDNGNRIVMGVEKNPWGKPVAYHLLTVHPGDYSYFRIANAKMYDRIPAEEMIHEFIRFRPTQTRGVPWMHSAMFKMNMLRGYEEAELVAARVSACKMGFFISPSGTEYTGEGKDKNNDTIKDAEAGAFEQLPKGMDFKPFDPQHPSGNYSAFIKNVLRSIASGVNVSYNSLASDLEGVNYSSMRSGTIEERENWKTIQSWMGEHFCQSVFTDWLDMAILSGQLKISASDLVKVSRPSWRPRGFAWVDPQKDMQANIEAVEYGLKTRSMVLSEQGYDIDDVFQELQKEKELAAKYGLLFSIVGKVPPQKPDPNAEAAGGSTVAAGAPDSTQTQEA